MAGAMVELADANYAAWLGLDAHEVHHEAGLHFGASATRLPAGTFNKVMATGAVAPDDTLARARAWFGARGRGFTVYCRARDVALAEACRREGLLARPPMPGMVLDAPPAAPAAPVHKTADPTGFVAVSLAAWEAAGLARPAVEKHFADSRRLLSPDVGIFVADHDGAPAATALGFLAGDVGGIYWVGTVPSARGRGLGAAVTAEAARWAFARGARLVCLQASEQGAPVYARLGFRTITSYPWFVAPLPR